MTISPARSGSDSASALAKAEQSGLSFLGTPGPGDSEGGEIYPPDQDSLDRFVREAPDDLAADSARSKESA